MSVPILYQGSQYYPGIPPSKQYPAFSAAEVGNVNASTVAVTFSVSVSASDYAAGVTIKVNGSAATISSGTRQINRALVYYVLSAAVVNGDTVTWEYSAGSIVNEATGAALQTTSAQNVTNNVVPALPAPLIDLEADILILSDGDPVSTWADQSGNGYDLTQTGTARPTKQTVGGYSTVRFDGINDLMVGQNWIAFDNLPTFTCFCIATSPDQNNLVGTILSKIKSSNSLNPADIVGWSMEAWGVVMDVQQLSNAGAYTIAFDSNAPDLSLKHICTMQIRDWNTDVKIFTDGSSANSGNSTGSPSVVTSIATSEPVRLGTTGDPTRDGYATMDLYCARFYAPALSDSDRAAVEAELAARYGITL